ncbi:SDR family oxidoreductase [Peribacillus tepidiphilus]|uniref:SDR family oxidoreductase n=1 Tax=Peribacillus tepidiphilus TaxID=2652445 RepID=UPI00129241FD|nr:SDR family oxidoreductase [Peribacillus tepidiphilus]
MNHVYFFTGFPGFICNQLIRELIRSGGNFKKAYMLVLPPQLDSANEEMERICKESNITKDHFVILEGDITQEELGIQKEQEKIKQEITHVFHLAAIYDLAVPQKIAYEVNVKGTKNVNDWVKTLPNLKRYTYFSTAYVAGKREGKLLETELIRPVSFKNYYEETKFEAEVLVDSLKKEVPITIIRPGIVRGHSKTGETIKFDGPYFILNFLDRLAFLPFYPYIGKGYAKINLVPVDFIIQATAFLALYEGAEGKTYHLTDPNPYTAEEIYEMFVRELYKKKPKGRIPLGLCRTFLTIVPLRKKLGVETEALDYFTWRGDFDCSLAVQDLSKAGIHCPDLKKSISSMVSFYLKNKQIKRFHVEIR